MVDASDEKKLGFWEFLSTAWWSIKIYWKINPKYALISVVLGALLELFAVLNNFVFAKVIDALVTVSQGERDFAWVYYAVLIFFVISIVRTAMGLAENYSRRMLQMYSYPKFQEMLFKKLMSLGVGTLERPDVNNSVARTQQNWRSVELQFQNSSTIISVIASLVGTGLVIFWFAPGLVPLIVLVTVPYIYFDRRYQKKLWSEDKRRTEMRRMAYNSSGVLQDPKMLQELTITGGSVILEKKFGSFVESWNAFVADLRSKFYRKLVFLRVVRSSVEAYANYLIIVRFLRGSITIGDVTFYFRSVAGFAGDIQSLSDLYSSMFESALRVREVKELFEMEPVFEDGKNVLPLMKSGPEIRLSEVSFSYPNSKAEVIKEINLVIKAGEKVAIVGQNGAGKTTLVKLLCRFYQVSKGAILVNDVNLNDVKVESWYKNLGVLFQDFNTYPHLTARENIVIGDVQTKTSKNKVRRFAKRADADEFIEAFEKGYDQVLSERYKGGTRPSTGQWQKIAIARFFYRDAPLVVFDEPTAAIDAESEKKIFDKIYKFFEGKTVIIISHRFSTVRNADRIIVFDKGRVVEHGSHQELMALGGKYARAFKIQAEGYKQ